MVSFAKFLGRIGEWGSVWVLTGVILALAMPDHRGEFLAAGFLATFSIGVNYAVKVLVRRPRPVLEGLPPLGTAPSSLSFPSAHTTAGFAAATAMTRIEPACAVLFVLAAAIAWCRPYLGCTTPPTCSPAPSSASASASPCHSASSAMPMRIGIVGLPNAGKSTLFNALTKGGAETGDYPFTTIDPNVAIARSPTSGSRGSPRPSARRASSRRRSSSPTSPAWSGRLRGRGARQPVPRRDSRDRRDLPRRPLPRRRGVPHPDGGSTRARHRDDRGRAAARRPGDRPSAGSSG